MITREHYRFHPAGKGDVSTIFRLILHRMQWMDEVGIRQWNVTKYDEVYPESYYEAARLRGDLFVLSDTRSGQIAACAVLKTADDRWPEALQAQGSAFYLHNFASRTDAKGAGAIFLQCAEEYARRCGKVYFRLDSADDNPVLEHYYTSRGYTPAGRCIDGLYTGVLRQKRLLPSPIRPATPADLSRIAEIEVFNYRLNFYPIFRSDEFYFDELTVPKLMQLRSAFIPDILVYDDGVVKGFLHFCSDEVRRLYVEPVLQGQGIGAALLEYAVREKHVTRLWALEKNTRAIAFYQRHGFHMSNERRLEEGTEEYLVRLIRE